MATLDITEINKTVKDGAYLAVGLGVLGFQKARVRRRELIESLETQRKQFTDAFAGKGGLTNLGSLPGFGPLETQRKQVLDTLEAQRKQFTEAFEAQTKQLTGSVETARNQLVELVKTVDGRLAPARQQFEDRIDTIEQHLPASAREAFKSVRTAVNTPETTLRSAVGLS